jgi:hypothetical protein
MSLQDMQLELEALDKLKIELDKQKTELINKRAETTKKRSLLVKAIALEKAKHEPSYINELSQLIGSDVTIKVKNSHYTVLTNDRAVAVFNLKELPGCCGVYVSFNCDVSSRYRKLGIGTLLNKMRQQIAWDHGYTLLICTDVDSNLPQQKILKKNNWDKLTSFINRNTDNMVSLHSILLKDTGIKIGMRLPNPNDDD